MTAFFPLPHPERQPEPQTENSENLLQFPVLVMNQIQLEQESAEYFLKLGNRHYDGFLTRSASRDLDIAINCYRKALENNPSLAEGYVKLASALFDKGEMNVETAIQYCQTALSMNPELGEANLYLGYFLGQAGQMDAAIKTFKAVIEKSPKGSPRPRMAYGRLLMQKALGKPELQKSYTDAARTKAAKANIKTPSLFKRLQWGVQGATQLSIGLMQLPSDAYAFNVFKTALISDVQLYGLLSLAQASRRLGLAATSMWLLDYGCQKLPEEAVFFHKLGDFYRSRRQSDTAIYYYQRAQELEPDNAQLLKKLAGLYLDHQDVDNAIACYEKALTHSEARQSTSAKNDIDISYQLARLLTDKGEYLKALFYFKEIAKSEDQHPRQGQNPYLHSNMAYVLFKLEDYDGAIQEYRKAVQNGDDPVWTATVAQTLGTLYHQVKRNPQAALEMFQLAYDLDPENLDCIAQLADLYIEQGHYESAIGAYQYLLSYEPENADCYSTIGYLLWQLDKNEEAIDAYHKSLQYKPSNPIAYNNLGVIYLDEYCRPEKAREMFHKAFEQNPDYTLACFNQGRAHEALGDTAIAAKFYSHALAMNKEFAELEEEDILSRIDGLFRV
ncbi:MAG: tetratricopeptide repeat protein [Vampirovibrionales bacterium]|nr:tetratricopeptide repeat protein [Vampirovibrionales bacterium]